MRILIADAQPHIRSALQVLLNLQPNIVVVGEANDARSLMTQIQTVQPDIILLDWELPGLVAIGSLAALRTNHCAPQVVVLSGRPEAHRQALAADADAFVSKMDPPEQLLMTLRTLAATKKGQNNLGLPDFSTYAIGSQDEEFG